MCGLNELIVFLNKPSTWWCLLLLVVSSLVFWLVYFYCTKVHVFHKLLKRFPSPLQVCIFGHALDFQTEDHLGVLSNYITEHDKTVLLNIAYVRFILLTSDHNLIKSVLESNNALEKSFNYKKLHRWLGEGLLTGDGERWRKNRAIIKSAFNKRTVENFVEVFEAYGKTLVERLELEVDKDSVDIHPYVALCTLDIICETAMGMPVNAQENSESDYVRSVKDMCRILIERAFNPYKMVEFIYRWTNDYESEIKNLEILHEYTNSVIKLRKRTHSAGQMRSRRTNNMEKMPFLDSLFREIYTRHIEMSSEEVREEVDTFMFAGHEMTASAISFALFCLATHPEVQHRVLEEQKKFLGDNEPVTMEKLEQMKYLEKVIKETLRLYPPVPYIAREVTENLVYGGTTLPKGLTIMMFIYALHRNPEYFPNPESFNPTRFDQIRNDSPMFMPFGLGLRKCIVERFAMAEMKSVVSRVVRSYELLPAVPDHQLQLAPGLVLISKNGVLIKLKKRNGGDESGRGLLRIANQLWGAG